ncbi:MAG TPA: glutaredoxin family protein [Steroidobacteraceae bacterium]|jgi:hypothetical protein
MIQWLVYSRQGCALCEEMLEELAQVLPPPVAATVVVQDVDADPELERKYGQRVPVLLVDGEFLCCYRLDRERMKIYLEGDSG